MLYQKFAAVIILLSVFVTGVGHARVVAIVDSGILPTPELAPFLVPGGFDFVNRDADPTDDNGHGTIVGLFTVAASNNQARLLPIKTFNSQAVGLTSWVSAGIAHAAANPSVRVINLSLSSGRFDVAQLNTIKRAAGRGKMIVVAAGNSGLPNPDFPAGTVGQLSGRGLAVGAVGPNNVIRPYSARAGSARRFYVVAPDFFEQGLGGTSFAAPQVSGVAAAIFAQSPFLSANDVVDIIRRTTIDLGAPGVDAIYGHGLLNRAAALGPVGTARIPTGLAVGGSSGDVGGDALTLGAPFAFAILDNSSLIGDTLILDEFDRAFAMDLADVVQVPDPVTRLSTLMRSFRQETSGVATELGTLRLNAWLSDDPALRSTYAFDVFGRADYEDRVPFASLLLESGAETGWVYGYGYNIDPRNVFGMVEQDGLQYPRFLSAEAFDAPYLSFADVSNTLHWGYRWNDRAQVRFGWTTTDESRRFGHHSQTATLQGTYRVNDALRLRASLSDGRERGGLFGGSSEGVFSIDGARTVAIGTGAEYRINPRLALIGQYTYGYTRVDDGTSSLLKDFSALHGEAYGLGLVASSVFRKEDRFGIMLSRPLRVTAGQVDLNVPFARDFDGTVYARSERVSLVPEGRETDVEVAYSLPLTGNVNLSGHLLWQHQPFHSPDVDDRMTAAVAVRVQF